MDRPLAVEAGIAGPRRPGQEVRVRRDAEVGTVDRLEPVRPRRQQHRLLRRTPGVEIVRSGA
jgi:hypothetical protein